MIVIGVLTAVSVALMYQPLFDSTGVACLQTPRRSKLFIYAHDATAAKPTQLNAQPMLAQESSLLHMSGSHLLSVSVLAGARQTCSRP